MRGALLYGRYKIDTKKVEIMSQEYQVVLQRKYKYVHPFPSTGILAVVYLLEHFPVGRCKLDPSLKATCFQPLNLRLHTVLST